MVHVGMALAASILCGAIQEEVDNPPYKNWSKFKVGAYVKLKSVTDAGGMKTETETVNKLVELDAKKAVVEMSSATMVMGNKMEAPPQKMEHPAKIKKGADASAEIKVKAEGDEEIEVTGKGKLKCHWTETERDQSGMKSLTKTWTCDDIPGLVVKLHMKSEGMFKSETVMTVVEFKTE